MKLFFPVIFTVSVVLFSCGNTIKKIKINPNDLPYTNVEASDNNLSAGLDLSADPVKQIVSAQLQLKNTGSQSLNIQEIAVATDEGIRALPVNAFAPFSLEAGKDTTLTLKYNPTNNLKLYQATGLQGNLKATYSVSAAYQASGNDSPLSLVLKSQLRDSDFAFYLKRYAKPVTGYSFDTKSEFNQHEKTYLATIRDIKQPPFVFMSEREIAVSGLNFRLQSYYLRDTLHADLFIVNHSDFEVKLNIDSIDIVANGKTASDQTKTASIEKLTGSQQYPNMIAKDDRQLIHFKKYLKTKRPGTDTLTFKLSNAFMLKGNKKLFNQDVRLLPKLF